MVWLIFHHVQRPFERDTNLSCVCSTSSSPMNHLLLAVYVVDVVVMLLPESCTVIDCMVDCVIFHNKKNLATVNLVSGMNTMSSNLVVIVDMESYVVNDRNTRLNDGWMEASFPMSVIFLRRCKVMASSWYQLNRIVLINLAVHKTFSL